MLYQVTIPRNPVPKNSTDIRVVWNCIDNGVNPLIYTPSLFLPTVNTLYRKIEVNMEQEDFDVSEEFHNYALAK